jgi:methylenetetrahydrofolate reductase (NADPH)
MAGLVPVPHMAARGFADARAAAELLARLRGEADVRAVLLIGGDIPMPAGEISETRELIDSGVLRQAGIERVGIAGHPEGHPIMRDEELESALVTKIAAAQSQGHEVEIVTQFGFEPKTLIRWLEWLRARGVNLPVKVGLAGPTSLMSWLGYARRCGVRASAEALARRSGLARRVFHTVAPDLLIRALVEARSHGRLGEISPTSSRLAASARRRVGRRAPRGARSPSTRKAAFRSSLWRWTRRSAAAELLAGWRPISPEARRCASARGSRRDRALAGSPRPPSRLPPA